MISPKKNRNEKSESKRLNWTCIPKKMLLTATWLYWNWWGFHSPPFVRLFGQMENADKWFSLNTCPLLINTFRKYIANESFEFQHLKCNRAQKSNELWAIDSNRKCILKRCVALSFNRAAYPFTGTLHTHAPKQYNARCHTVHLSVCQPEWNWANKICDHIYLSMLHRAYSPFTEWKCENKACFVRLKSIVQ